MIVQVYVRRSIGDIIVYVLSDGMIVYVYVRRSFDGMIVPVYIRRSN